jgi:hypothetical protein
MYIYTCIYVHTKHPSICIYIDRRINNPNPPAAADPAPCSTRVHAQPGMVVLSPNPMVEKARVRSPSIRTVRRPSRRMACFFGGGCFVGGWGKGAGVVVVGFWACVGVCVCVWMCVCVCVCV